MTTELRLPQADRSFATYRLRSRPRYPERARPAQSRVAYAAAHVVADPLAETVPERPAGVDWEATLAFRRHLWGLGLGVAEAMDTAQRGMGLDAAACGELIRRSAAEARACGGRLACGAQTDHVPAGSCRGLQDVVRAYLEQCRLVEDEGARVVLMASHELCRLARGPEDYQQVYAAVLGGLRRPAIIHWLGEVFDPALRGYWGALDLDQAAEACLEVITANRDRVDGIKVSLLDQRRELAMRRRLPEGVRLYTGDDFDYPEAIAGDGDRHSDALLGAFDMIAPAAAAALAALDAGDEGEFRRLLEPTLPLARHVFSKPTPFYKVGVVFLAYLNGHQAHFRMLGGLESARSIVHLARTLVLADQADLLVDPERAAHRMRPLLALAGC